MATVKSSLKYGVLTFLLLFTAVQFLPLDRSNPPGGKLIPAPSDVQQVLQKACYDCHSNQTRWPWYSRVAPFSWLVAHDVQEGRQELNFSRWDQYTPTQKMKKLKKVVEEVEEGEMPPRLYLWLHPEAALKVQDRELLIQWARDLSEQIRFSAEEAGALSKHAAAVEN